MDTKTKRILMILLAISFSINLLLVGFIAGKSMNKPKQFRPHDLPRLSWILRELPDEKKEKIRPLIEQHRENRREKFRQHRELRKRTHQLLVAETFNKEEFEKTLNELRRSRMEEQLSLISNLGTIAENLSQKERVRLSEILDKRAKHRRKRDRHRRREHE